MFWKNEKDQYGWVSQEKVQVYELKFTSKEIYRGSTRNCNRTCLIVANTIEEAIAACRQRFPSGFVLHSAVKRNQQCDLIVCESVLPLAEKGSE